MSLFAYGQTGAGKSYSMMGYGPDKGIIPIASEDIFRRITEQQCDDVVFRVEASMMEIYNEKVRDLFNPGAGGAAGLKVRDNPKIGSYVQDLTRNAVADYPSIEHMMELGTAARTVAATEMNATSSRAHTVFQVTNNRACHFVVWTCCVYFLCAFSFCFDHMSACFYSPSLHPSLMLCFYAVL